MSPTENIHDSCLNFVGIPTEGEAGGLSVRLICKVGEGALARLGRVDGDLQMVIVPCSIFEPPANKVQARLDECGIPFWPHGFVTAHADMDSLLESWTNEYACLGYGADLARPWKLSASRRE